MAAIELVDCQINLVTPKAPIAARVVATRLATASKKAAGFVRHVEFDVSGTPLAGKAVAGQSFGVLPPGTDANGKPHKLRLYSLASPTRGEDGAGHVVSTTVKRLIDEHNETHHLHLGLCSNYICNLQVGDTVQMTGPSGKRFLLPKSKNDFGYVFFATGTGIAPFRGMIIDLLEAGSTAPIALVAGSPYSTDLLYDGFFKDLAAKHTNFHYLPTLSRELQSDGKPKMYIDQRLSEDKLLSLVSRDNTLIYMCGLAGMEQGVYAHLSKLLPSEKLTGYLHATADQVEALKAGDKDTVKKVEKTERLFVEVY
jgi:ferredoxin--NADP+ reductase